MKILNFEIKHNRSGSNKYINLNNGVVLIHSVRNMTGKTTLLRALLYALGYNIPDTQMVKFKEYTFQVHVIIKGKSFEIIRNDNYIKVNSIEFDLPTDRYQLHEHLFDTTNHGILYNLLATHYFDQEKGWTLLNRGTIIGENKFNIESFFRALNDKENINTIQKIEYLENQISRYKLMFDVSKYQEKIKEEGLNQLIYTTRDEENDMKISSLKYRESEIDSEITALNKVINENKSFVKYIENKRLTVDFNGEKIPVNSSTLSYFSENDDYSIARKKMLISERNIIKNELSKRISEYNEKNTLLDIKEKVEEFSSALVQIDIDSVQVERILENIKKEKNELEKQLQEFTQFNNEWINDFYSIVHAYIDELELPFQLKKIMVFTRKLKGLSGAILHKLVFAYKLGYIKLLESKLGINLPIIIDSPSGREVFQSTITTMMNILKRDFNNHQIIIASIHKYNLIFPDANVITMDRSLFNTDKNDLF